MDMELLYWRSLGYIRSIPGVHINMSHLSIYSVLYSIRILWYTLVFKMLWSNIFLALCPLLSLTAASTPPPPPALSYLYTAYVQCAGNLMETDGPHGLRKTIPIVGGNFTGPRLSGIPYILLTQCNPYSKSQLWLTDRQAKSSTSVQTGAPQTPGPTFSQQIRGTICRPTTGRISLFEQRGPSRRRDSCIYVWFSRRGVRSTTGWIILLVSMPLSGCYVVVLWVGSDDVLRSHWRLDECWENGEFVCVEDWCVECEFSSV